MKDLEMKIRQLEIENIGLKFQTSLLLDKNHVTIEEMKKYAEKALNNFPKTEEYDDIIWYLNGLIKGEE